MLTLSMRASSLAHLTLLALPSLVGGCSVDDPLASSLADAPSAQTAAPDDTPEGLLFGERVESYATMSDNTVTAVGVVIPLAAIRAAPENAPFQDDLVLDMPAAAKAQTFVSQLRVNWLAHGHGPVPYRGAHFDFHFHRGTTSDIDGIRCDDPPEFAPAILSPAHQPPSLCVEGMGYHAWPKNDALPGATFTASLILGYTPAQLVFIEPMITRDTLLAQRDFELAITPPEKSGAATPTRFPTRVRGLYAPDGLTLRLELDRFVDLD
ncbi:MAG: DUF5602 domain-containing protein [Polyangiales bacterium]